MKAQDYTESMTVNASAHEAFNAINSVSQWWTEDLEGSSRHLNDEFTVRFGDVHVSTQKLVEVVHDKRDVWHVTASNLSFIKDQHEWTGTKISFDLAEKDGKTQITFTHTGLVPDVECYNGCTNAWGHYLKGSLVSLISTGKGQPTPKEGQTAAAKEAVQ